jgi:putative restriction endonuclease
MNYYWVNQKQTYKQERKGGYLWAPKKDKRGKPKWFWETMLLVQPGDIIFNHVKGTLRSYCIAQSSAYDHNKPTDIEQDWDELGWKIDVVYYDIANPVVVNNNLDKLKPLFPEKYSPYTLTGNKANQFYLVPLSHQLGSELAIIAAIDSHDNEESDEDNAVPASNGQSKVQDDEIPDAADFQPTLTEKETLIKQRITQGRFREDLMKLYDGRCAVTGLDVASLLIASHIKPWSESNSKERNDTDNGLLLAAHLDKLFDQHLISFDVQGKIIISNSLTIRQRDLLGINNSLKIKTLTVGNQKYLAHHRKKFK